MEEKFFVKRQEKRLNVSSREKGRLKGRCTGLWNRTEVRALTNVASGFISWILVGVRCYLGEEDNKQQR